MTDHADLVKRLRISAVIENLCADPWAHDDMLIYRCGHGEFSVRDLRALLAITQKAEKMREALEYVRPIVVRYAHTQGDNAEYHAEIVAPIDAALKAWSEE